jgi:hypothetical protein
MYVNGKMRPAETIPEMREGGIQDNDGGVNSSMIYLIYCKNFCKCPQCTLSTIIFGKKKKDIVAVWRRSLQRNTTPPGSAAWVNVGS